MADKATMNKRRGSTGGGGGGAPGDDEFTKGMGGPALEGEKLEMFYEAPPGLVKEDEERPEDAVPDMPGNEQVREFLAKAPTKGLWMPLGKEVKCMQCWRCKQYGHRTGDRECPLRDTGNAKSEAERQARMDPMYQLMQQNKSTHGETKKETTSEGKGQSLRDLAKQLMEMAEEKKRKKKEKKEKKKKEKKEKKERKEKKEKKRKREKEEKKHRDKDRDSRDRDRDRDRRDRDGDSKRDRDRDRERDRSRDRDRDRDRDSERRDRDRHRDSRDRDRDRDSRDHGHRREKKRRRHNSDSDSDSNSS